MEQVRRAGSLILTRRERQLPGFIGLATGIRGGLRNLRIRLARHLPGLSLFPWIPLALAACGGQESGDESGTATRVPVTIAPVRQDSISEVLTLVGRLVPTPGSVATLSAPTAGTVRIVRVQVGERVRPGTVLIEIEAPELEANAAALEATALAAEQDARRQEALLADGIAARRDVEERLATAASARAAADAARRLLDQTLVRSPIAGGVQRVQVNAGERVESGTPLAEIVRGGPLDLVASVPQDRLGRLQGGTGGRGPGRGRHDDCCRSGPRDRAGGGFPFQRRHGRDPGRRGPRRRSGPGAGATATVTTGVAREALIVPETALVLVGDSMAVFVIGADSVAHRRAVAVGMRRAGRAQVEGDLHLGDQVAATGAYGLAEGMHVLPAAAEAP